MFYCKFDKDGKIEVAHTELPKSESPEDYMQVDFEWTDIDYIRLIDGVPTKDINLLAEEAKQKAISDEITALKDILSAYSEDIVQDLVGEKVPDIDIKKAQFLICHNRLRELLELSPRDMKE